MQKESFLTQDILVRKRLAYLHVEIFGVNQKEDERSIGLFGLATILNLFFNPFLMLFILLFQLRLSLLLY